jgi:hypothetical protein
MGITKRLKKKTGKRNPNGAIAGNEETGQEKKKKKEKKRESPALGMVHTLRPSP